MKHETLEKTFIVRSGIGDRRAERRSEPPYLTEEGMVLIDRRESNDRRASTARLNAKFTVTQPEMECALLLG